MMIIKCVMKTTLPLVGCIPTTFCRGRFFKNHFNRIINNMLMQDHAAGVTWQIYILGCTYVNEDLRVEEKIGVIECSYIKGQSPSPSLSLSLSLYWPVCVYMYNFYRFKLMNQWIHNLQKRIHTNKHLSHC